MQSQTRQTARRVAENNQYFPQIYTISSGGNKIKAIDNSSEARGRVERRANRSRRGGGGRGFLAGGGRIFRLRNNVGENRGGRGGGGGERSGRARVMKYRNLRQILTRSK